jgi:predicted membrane protein
MWAAAHPSHWHSWARTQLRLPPSEASSCVHTSAAAPLLYYAGTLLVPALMPSLSQVAGSVSKTAAEYVLRQSVERIASAQWGSKAATALVDQLLAMPMQAFSASTPSRAVTAFVQKQQHQPTVMPAPPKSGNALQWALALSTIGTLLLEYIGMFSMADNLPRLRHLNMAQPNDPSLTAQCQRFLHKRYDTQAYNSRQLLSLHDSDPVRTVYNLLVGLNTVFFKLTGSQSSDSTAELIHWGAIWFYWEVLAHLVHLYGLSPVTIAYRQVYAGLLQLPK